MYKFRLKKKNVLVLASSDGNIINIFIQQSVAQKSDLDLTLNSMAHVCEPWARFLTILNLGF